MEASLSRESWIGVSGRLSISYFILFWIKEISGPDFIKYRTGSILVKFNPIKAAGSVRKLPHWRWLNGGSLQSAVRVARRFEYQFQEHVYIDIQSLPLRDSDYFVAGGIHDHFNEWAELLKDRKDQAGPSNDMIKSCDNRIYYSKN